MLARIALALPLVAAVSLAACAAPTADESTKSTNSSLVSARPILRVTASKASKKALGVTEWRIYKSKKEFVVNGYDAKGYAVKGASFGFVGKSQTSSSKVHVRLLDGSKTSGTYDFQHAPNASGSFRATTASFLEYAIADMKSVAAQASSGSLQTQGHFLPAGTPAQPQDPGANTIPTNPTTPTTQSGCGISLGNLGSSGMQCIQSVLGALLGGSQPNLQTCMSAATSVLGNVTSCIPGMGGIGTSAQADPNADPNAQGQGQQQDPNAQDPNGQDPNAQDPNGQDPNADPNGGFAQQDPNAFADQAAQNQTCASCPQGADDLMIDDGNGGVGLDGF